jgi:hypothetical protein
VSSLEEEEDQMKALEEMGKPMGVITTFNYKEIVEAFIPFFAQFHSAASSTSATINLICFINYFIVKHVHTSEEVKKTLFETKEVLLKFHRLFKQKYSSDTRSQLSIQGRSAVGKYIDTETYERLLHFAKEKAGELERQVYLYLYIHTYIHIYITCPF